MLKGSLSENYNTKIHGSINHGNSDKQNVPDEISLSYEPAKVVKADWFVLYIYIFFWRFRSTVFDEKWVTALFDLVNWCLSRELSNQTERSWIKYYFKTV